MDGLALNPPPVGVRVLQAGSFRDFGAAKAHLYQGVSYCDAVRRAGEGDMLHVLPGSIQVCQWSPVVLGFQEAKGCFEQGLAPRLDFPVAGLLLAPLDRFPGEPDVVLVRASAHMLHEMAKVAGQEWLWEDNSRRLDRSASRLLGEQQPDMRQRLITAANRPLAALARYTAWRRLTHWLFRCRAITVGWEAVISRTMADMSMCRNSTVIPLLTGRANVSFFCSGGITWGRNRADHLTSGWPWDIYQRTMNRSHFMSHASRRTLGCEENDD
jgi:uncharacterized protein (DUF169 family)